MPCCDIRTSLNFSISLALPSIIYLLIVSSPLSLRPYLVPNIRAVPASKRSSSPLTTNHIAIGRQLIDEMGALEVVLKSISNNLHAASFLAEAIGSIGRLFIETGILPLHLNLMHLLSLTLASS